MPLSQQPRQQSYKSMYIDIYVYKIIVSASKLIKQTRLQEFYEFHFCIKHTLVGVSIIREIENAMVGVKANFIEESKLSRGH